MFEIKVDSSFLLKQRPNYFKTIILSYLFWKIFSPKFCIEFFSSLLVGLFIFHMKLKWIKPISQL